jgi:tetratricopeptide (TPR) repeat protein
VYDEPGILEGGTGMKTIGKIILPGLLLLMLTGCGKDSAVIEQQMQLRSQGMEQALSGNYEEAVESYDQALALADMSVDDLELDIAAYKASALYQEGDLQGAIDLCSAILDLKPSAEIYLTRGLLYRDQEDQEAANADFTAAMKLTSSKDTVMLGRLSLYMEDYAGAKEYLESAAADGDNEAVYWQAELYWQMGNEEYAVSLYQSYLEGEDPTQQSAYAKVAAYQMKQEDYDSALATLEAGIAMGDSGSLHELLGDEIAVYEQKGDFTTAKEKMETFLEQYPEDEDAAREYKFLKTR